MAHPPLSVYVINLQSRPERWETIKKMCLLCGIHPIRVNAIKESPGWIGCAKSHQLVAETAESKGEPWYVVLEDDAVLMHDDWKRFVNLLPRLWELRDTWQIFNGGMGGVTDIEIIDRNPPIFKAGGILTHFLIVNSNGYNLIKGWTPEKNHVDQYFKSNAKMVGTYPFISSQAESPSDIGIGNPQGDYDYGHKVVREKLLAENIIEKFLNMANSERVIANHLREAFQTRAKSQTPLQKILSYFNF